MSSANQRTPGKLGQLWMQQGSTVGNTTPTLVANTAAATFDGMTYAAYQVYTYNSGAVLDPSYTPTLNVSGASIPTAYTWEFSWIRGKVIFTPTLGATGVVTMQTGTWATPNILLCGDVDDFSIDEKSDVVETSGLWQGFKSLVLGLRSWSGSASIFWKNSNYWSYSIGNPSTDAPTLLRFYPLGGSGLEYFTGYAYINWGLKVSLRDAVKQPVSFEGTGPLVYVTT